MIRKLIKRIINPHTYSSEAYVRYLKYMGVEVGVGCKIYSPNQTYIDIQRTHMLHIGNYVRISRNATILTHDYSRSVVAMCLHDNVGEAGVTWIGDNVFIGVNATILMGTHIGNNTIVGAGGVLSGKYPDDVVIAGNPAKVICNIDAFAEKRRRQMLDNAVLYAQQWKNRRGRYPTIREMTNAFSWLYLPHEQDTIVKYPELFCLGGIDEVMFKKDFLSAEPQFPSYESFLDYVNSQGITP